MMLFTIFSFLLAGWVAGSGTGSGLFLGEGFDGAGKGICSVGGGRMGSAAVLCESAVMFRRRLLKILTKESQSALSMV